MKKDPQIYLAHIRDAIQAIREYTEEGKDVFLKDRKTQDAVIRNLEIIGEAVKNLPSEMTSRHQSVPWKNIAGMRDRLIHHYFGVNLKMVWGVVENRLDELDGVIQKEFNLLL
ncbi:MAG: DUF86 domain-containing protein [Kiritimatiellales bacterium]|nr:DUF86 domain-containing protein [Kiritimatiellota bacterium]MBL7016169.1 DUF86 domain-containing protein [Kiritimatiellales bacterium]